LPPNDEGLGKHHPDTNNALRLVVELRKVEATRRRNVDL